MRKSHWIVALVVFSLLVFAGTSVCFADSVYDRVKDTGVVRVGLMYNSIPAAYFDENNKWVGFDVDIAEEVVKRIGGYLGKI